jgi:hypothetical protein
VYVPLPLDMLGGLAMPIYGSLDLRGPTSPVCSSFNYFNFVMSIRRCVVAKPGS